MVGLLFLFTLHSIVAGNADCSFKAIRDIEKVLRCPSVIAPSCLNASSVNVRWCINRITKNEPWTVCLDTNSTATIFNVDSPLTVNVSGQLVIPSRVINQFDEQVDVINCSVIDTTTGDVCHETSSITLSIIIPYVAVPTINNYTPSNRNSVVTAGKSLLMCASGRSNGVVKILATHSDLPINPTIANVSMEDCNRCSCVKESDHNRFRTLFTDSNERVHLVLNLRKADSCQLVYDFFELYLYISRSDAQIAGNFEFNFFDNIGLSLKNYFSFIVSVEYELIDPVIHYPLPSNTSTVITNTSLLPIMIPCNVTTSVGAPSAEWAGPDVVNITSSCLYDTSEDDFIDCICGNHSADEGNVFSVTISMDTVYASNSAELLETVVSLILCDATPTNESVNYICIAGNLNRTVSIQIVADVSPDVTTPINTTMPIKTTPTSTTMQLITITTNSTASTNPSSDNVFDTIIISFSIALSFLMVLVVILVVMVIACRYLLHRPMQQVGGVNRNLYNWFPLVDKKEFSREQLIFVEKTGEGQFGEVWKAIAPGIVPGNQARNIVAVKKIKESATWLESNILLEELETMKNIQPHLNIVNLIGYCTLPKHKPLLIIMEFADHGNLKEYLVSLHRILQAKSSTSTHQSSLYNHSAPTELSSLPRPSRCSTPISPTLSEPDHGEREASIMEGICRCDSSQCMDQQCTGNQIQHNYVNIPMYRTTDGDNLDNRPVLLHYSGNGNDYNNLNKTNTSGKDEDKSSTKLHITLNSDTKSHCDDGGCDHAHILNDSSHLPQQDMTDDPFNESFTNKPTPPELLTSKFIVESALQIARGMEHLEKMKCLHRDLAARNILIAEGFLLKVSDFGLARNVSDSEYYRRHAPGGHLPACWMAIESLDKQQVHTHKSDVWSYAVVLWEIQTYGKHPYAGLGGVATTCDSVLHYLKEGNRLPRPHHCTNEMHELMEQCWNSSPTQRPSFVDIVRKLDKLLSIEHGYLALSEQRNSVNASACRLSFPSGSHSCSRSHSHSPFPISSTHSPISIPSRTPLACLDDSTDSNNLVPVSPFLGSRTLRSLSPFAATSPFMESHSDRITSHSPFPPPLSPFCLESTFNNTLSYFHSSNPNTQQSYSHSSNPQSCFQSTLAPRSLSSLGRPSITNAKSHSHNPIPLLNTKSRSNSPKPDTVCSTVPSSISPVRTHSHNTLSLPRPSSPYHTTNYPSCSPSPIITIQDMAATFQDESATTSTSDQNTQRQSIFTNTGSTGGVNVVYTKKPLTRT